ncbi:MAG: hypothetical protein EPO25_18510 [Gammaproteobacteria bacterium]|nr:MAG: hypothetical protein EPO25_18510 [Gammaproteobacteria bacterium]
MIIHPVRLEQEGGGVRLAARIEAERGEPLPAAELWYEFPGATAGDFSGSADGFAAALVLLAMQRAEPLRVRGPVSAVLLRGLREYQQVFRAWFPEQFHVVEIACDEVRAAGPPVAPRGVATAFSGGVDSSYTLLTHLPGREPDPARRVDHALFVHGFDIPLADTATFATAAATYARALGEHGVRLITARTNVREFADLVGWELAHGSALGSVALLPDALLARCYIPSSFPDSDLIPWGSHPVADPLLSSATLQLIHDVCRPRFDKVAALAGWPPALSWLRVCWEQPHGSRNCCRCRNCLRTMIALDLAGVLKSCPTFPEPLEGARIRRMRLPPEDLTEVATIELPRLRAAGRTALADDLQAAVRASRRQLAGRRLYRGLRAAARRVLGRGSGSAAAPIAEPRQP